MCAHIYNNYNISEDCNTNARVYAYFCYTCSRWCIYNNIDRVRINKDSWHSQSEVYKQYRITIKKYHTEHLELESTNSF